MHSKILHEFFQLSTIEIELEARKKSNQKWYLYWMDELTLCKSRGLKIFPNNGGGWARVCFIKMLARLFIHRTKYAIHTRTHTYMPSFPLYLSECAFESHVAVVPFDSCRHHSRVCALTNVFSCIRLCVCVCMGRLLRAYTIQATARPHLTHKRMALQMDLCVWVCVYANMACRVRSRCWRCCCCFVHDSDDDDDVGCE